MRRITVAALCLLLAGCGVIDRIRGKNDEVQPLEPEPVPEITESVTLERAWDFEVGGDGQAGLRPALAAATVFVASPEGQVAAVDIESGSVRWRERLEITVSGGVGTGEGLVLLGGLDGEVVALDTRDGSEVWRASVDSEVMAPPRADAGTVVVRTIDGAVQGLSTNSGEQRWIVRREVPSLTLRGSGPPLMRQGVAVMGFADGKMAAIKLDDGAILWEITVARPSGTNEVERMIDVDATPVLRGNILYTVSFQGNITASALGADQTLWRREVSSHNDVAVEGNEIYLSDSTGRVHALNRETGETLWVQESLLRRRLSGPAVVGDYVVVGDYEGYLHVLDRSDGELVGRRQLDERIAAQPLVRGGRILVMDEAGRLTALSAASADSG